MNQKKTEESTFKLPPRKLPLMYLYFGGFCFLSATVATCFLAEEFLGFFYSPHLLAITHLITLGWISANILGVIYIAAPMTLQLWLAATYTDYLMFFSFAIGVVGIVIHFWTATPLGIAGSGVLIYATFVGVAIRVFSGLTKAKAPGFVKMHIIFSFSNILIAALWGILIALNKEYGFLTTRFTSNLYSHIHLAAIGWVLFMIFGFAYRLIPMFVPGAPAMGTWPWISGILMETGVLTMFLFILLKPEWMSGSAISILIGILIFLVQVLRTIVKRKPVPPPEPPLPDYSILHVLLSFLWLICSAVAGVILLNSFNEHTMRLSIMYGFAALVCSMSQIIIGMRPKLLSIFTWYHVFAKQKSTENLPRPIDMGDRYLQAIAFVLWTISTILFAISLLTNHYNGILAASILLTTAVVTGFFNEWKILKRIS
ncbi:MAG TPA: hypothetical protein VLH08_00725 [Acidobacteriota bacterium]|nr:hypothetical protein [Acidobacteriota bacterium]